MFAAIFWILFFVVYAAAFGFVVYKFYHGYLTATGTVWERLHATFTASTTLVWGYAQIIGSYIIENIDKLSNAVNAPEIGGFVMSKIDPAWGASIVFLFGLITLAARLRSLFDR
jgi:hypothetical protein